MQNKFPSVQINYFFKKNPENIRKHWCQANKKKRNYVHQKHEFGGIDCNQMIQNVSTEFCVAEICGL